MRAAPHVAGEWRSRKAGLLLIACLGLVACDDPPVRNKDVPAHAEATAPSQAGSLSERVAAIFSDVAAVRDPESLDEFYRKISALLGEEGVTDPELERVVNAILTRGDFEVRKGGLPPDFGQLVLARLSSYDPILAWKLWCAGGVDVRPLAGDRSRLEIISKMMERDPVAAMGLFRANSSAANPVLQDAFKWWLVQDQAAAEEWLQDAREALAPGESDLVAAAVLDHQGGQSFSKDQELLEGVHEPVLKETLAKMLESRCAERLRPSIKENAPAAMSALAAARTEEAIWSLGVALSEWLRKDQGAAFVWFEERRATLDDKQSDVVAERFANEALRRQDETRARQWVASIRDEATREKVGKRIDDTFDGE